MSGRALILVAPHSGAGKTTLLLALLAAFRAAGRRVAGAKIGPDYLDPGFHAAISGRPAFNLDPWAMGAACAPLLAYALEGVDLLLIEAAMGLFDGMAGSAPRRPAGSAAEFAARFRLPVVLVVDARGMGQSVAALARGFAAFDPDVEITGVILNRVASPRHAFMLKEALEAAGIRCWGAFPREAAVGIESRHLGLVQAEERDDLEPLAERLADLARASCDLAALEAAARPPVPAFRAAAASPPILLPPPAQRIAIARDAAFSFLYPHLVAGWRAAGAELSFFSPLADEAPDEHAEFCWLPGGYPELHASRLAAARRFQEGLRRFAATRPVHGECGGFMVLGHAIEDEKGIGHAMAGLLDLTTSFRHRRLSLGYRRARLIEAHPLGAADTCFRGHEFHYAQIVAPGNDAPLFALTDGGGESLGEAGLRRGQVSGSFFHLIAEDAIAQERVNE